MYNIGDYVIYKRDGVCRIEGISHLAMAAAEKCLYYHLRPVKYEGRIYVPVNQDGGLRPLIGSGEARALLDSLAALPAPVSRARQEVPAGALRRAAERQHLRRAGAHGEEHLRKAPDRFRHIGPHALDGGADTQALGAGAVRGAGAGARAVRGERARPHRKDICGQRAGQRVSRRAGGWIRLPCRRMW